MKIKFKGRGGAKGGDSDDEDVTSGGGSSHGQKVCYHVLQEEKSYESNFH